MSSEDIKLTGFSLREISDPNTRRTLESILSNIDVIKSSIYDLENPLAPVWKDLVLENGWVQSSTIDAVLPKYSKNKFNKVSVRGVISSGTTTNGTQIFNIPEGHRPSKIEVRQILEDTGSGDAHVHIAPDGDVTIYRVTSSAELSIAFDFYAER